MSTSPMTIKDAAEASARLVLDGGYVERWVEGSIFPSEMAFFLAVCDVEGVSNVIESGRQDGYSTEILGDWASRAPGRRAISIDLETDAARARACRDRLARWPALELVKGNAYAEFGRVANRLARTSQGKTAFLVDGPKKAPAISMMSAAISDSVSVVSSHNLIIGSQEYDFFTALGGQDIFFENVLPDPGPNWIELRERDIAHASQSQAARSVEKSSIGVVVLNAETRKRMRDTSGADYGLHQPSLVRSLWSIGAYDLTPKVYGLSYKLLKR